MKHKISNLFWLKWIKKYKETNKFLYYFFLYSFIIFSILLCFILYIILPFIYIGIKLQEKKIYTELYKRLRKIKKKSKIKYYFIKIVIIFTLLFSLTLLFTIYIYVLIGIGIFIQKRKDKIQVDNNPMNIKYQIEKNIKQPILYSRKMES